MEIKRIRIFSNNNKKSLGIKDILISKLEEKGFIIDEFNYDLGIAVGGDGSFLRMIKESNFNSNIFYIGVNAGTLGFAQEVDVRDIDKFISDLKNNNLIYEELGVLENSVYTKDSVSRFYSLNEIVVREKNLNTVKLKIEIDNHLLEKFAGDGILISTSFGSTAYNVFHSIQLTPIAPLNNKSYRNIINSVVLPQNKVIKISPVKTKDLLISVDGENNIYTDVLYVQTVIQNKIIKCLRNKEYNFIDKINEKFIK